MRFQQSLYLPNAAADDRGGRPMPRLGLFFGPNQWLVSVKRPVKIVFQSLPVR
jgi:hypothetical protein